MGTDDLHRRVAARLSDHDQQYTANRRSVVDVLAGGGAPMTLPELLAAAAGSLAQSSAYRCLAVLVDAGVVRRLVHGGDHARFELDEQLTEHHHHHLVCDVCGSVADVTLPHGVETEMDRSFAAAALQQDFAPTHHAIDIYGTCAACR